MARINNPMMTAAMILFFLLFKLNTAKTSHPADAGKSRAHPSFADIITNFPWICKAYVHFNFRAGLNY